MSLAIDCARIRREVGRMIGLSRDPADWSADSVQDVWDVIDSGLSQFYTPPRAHGERKAHQWSFLQPLGSIDFVVDQDEYELPVNYAGLIGTIFYAPNDNAITPTQINTTSEAVILQRQSHERHIGTHGNCPTLAAIRPSPTAASGSQQTYVMMVWPKPTIAATVKFKYHARQNQLRNDNDVPLGGEEHGETILASCLAVAEVKFNDDSSLHRGEFDRRLQASIDIDRATNAADSLGYYGDRRSQLTGETYFRTSNLIDYVGWDE